MRFKENGLLEVVKDHVNIHFGQFQHDVLVMKERMRNCDKFVVINITFKQLENHFFYS